MSRFLQLRVLLCVAAFLVVGGWWFTAINSPPIVDVSPTVTQRTPQQRKFVTPKPPTVSKDAAILRRIARIERVQPRVATQWSGVSQNILFSRDGSRFAQSASSFVEVRRTKNWKSFFRFGGRDTFALSSDFRLLATPDSFATINVWRLSDRKLLVSLDGASDIYWPLSFSPDNKQLAAIGLPESLTSREGPTNGYPQLTSKELRIWQLDKPRKPHIEAGPVTGLEEGLGIGWTKVKSKKAQWKAFSFAGYGDSKIIAGHTLWIRADKRFIEARDDTTGELLSFVRRPSKMGPIALAPDATLFAGADASEPLVYIWRVSDARLMATIEKKGAQKASSLAFSSDARQLAVSFLDSPASTNIAGATPTGSTVIYALYR